MLDTLGLAHLKTCSEIEQDVIAAWPSADGDTNGQVLDVVADGGIVRNLSEWNRDFGAFVEGRIDLVEDAEWRQGRGLVSVLPSRGSVICARV